MCLFTKQLLPRRAKKPIVVYKVVYEERKNVFHTPFKHEPIEAYGHMQASGPLTGTPRYASDMTYYITTVGNGYIHAYRDLRDAEDWCRFYNRCSNKWYNYKVMECIIEPGTLYYKNNTEICARSITTKGVVYQRL